MTLIFYSYSQSLQVLEFKGEVCIPTSQALVAWIRLTPFSISYWKLKNTWADSQFFLVYVSVDIILIFLIK